jgi:hypothetical protein
MSNDRELLELLELAAKAAGYEVDRQASEYIWQEELHQLVLLNLQGGHTLWNPLTDEADALRLAVKLEMCIDFMDRRVIAGKDMPEVIYEFEDGDYRWAIVRAAASLGGPRNE